MHCEADVRPGQEIWTLTVDQGDIDTLLDHEYVQMVGSAANVSPVEGRILRSRGNRVEVHALGKIGDTVRKNLRMPVRFRSFLYPVSGHWKGRREIISHDLSCGGIAFFCKEPMEAGEIVEVVIPVTAAPLVLQICILRQRPSPGEIPLYAAKFLPLTQGEETMVREAVFSLQIDSVD